MQTEAEKYLIALLRSFLQCLPGRARLLNLGAANSVVIEEELCQGRLDFICDRSDIQPSTITRPYIGKKYVCPIENMEVIPTSNYEGVFANFVLEHISDSKAAAAEMARILKPGGELFLSLSNPWAPEFLLAQATPTAFHQLWREEGHDPAYPTKYAYGTIERLIKQLENSGLTLIEDHRLPATYSYLHRFFLLGTLSLGYDKLLSYLRLRSLMGHSVLHLRK